MNNIYESNKDAIKEKLKIIWDYMKLNQPLEKCDLIIGCGCANLDIPVKCATLLKEGYAPKILFAGGYGKITKDSFKKTEAEIYRDIAIEQGIDEKDILLETKSTNTGDNFKFASEVLDKNNIKYDKILIVHKPLNERRTLSAAKAIFKDKQLIITSYDMTFEEYFEKLNNKPLEDIINGIGIVLGDVQRIVIYPQFGWQVENEVPETVKEAYYYLKKLGFSKYILSKEQIKELISKHGIVAGQREEYFC